LFSQFDDDLDETVPVKDEDNETDTDQEMSNAQDCVQYLDEAEGKNGSQNKKEALDVKERDENQEAINSLDNKVRDMSEESSSPSDSDSSSSDSDEDEVAKLSAAKDHLKNQLDKMKKELATSKRNLTLTNNLRVAHQEEIQKLKKELQTKCDQIFVLQKRNSSLQDIICQTSQGTISKILCYLF